MGLRLLLHWMLVKMCSTEEMSWYRMHEDRDVDLQSLWTTLDSFYPKTFPSILAHCWHLFNMLLWTHQGQRWPNWGARHFSTWGSGIGILQAAEAKKLIISWSRSSSLKKKKTNMFEEFWRWGKKLRALRVDREGVVSTTAGLLSSGTHLRANERAQSERHWSLVAWNK